MTKEHSITCSSKHNCELHLMQKNKKRKNVKSECHVDLSSHNNHKQLMAM